MRSSRSISGGAAGLKMPSDVISDFLPRMRPQCSLDAASRVRSALKEANLTERDLIHLLLAHAHG